MVRVLETLSRTRKLPQRITVDNGTAFTSRAVDAWAYWNKVQLDFSRPRKPVDNCFIEAFNGSLRRECLSQHWFASIIEAQQILEAWRVDYNTERPHQSLADLTPMEFLSGGHFIPGLNRLAFLSLLVAQQRGGPPDLLQDVTCLALCQGSDRQLRTLSRLTADYLD